MAERGRRTWEILSPSPASLPPGDVTRIPTKIFLVCVSLLLSVCVCIHLQVCVFLRPHTQTDARAINLQPLRPLSLFHGPTSPKP